MTRVRKPALPLTARVLAARVLAQADEGEVKPRYEAAAAQLADPRERALLKELLYGALRRRLQLDDLLATASGHKVFRVDPDLAPIMRVAAHQLVFLDRIPAHAAVDAAVEHAKLAHGAKRAGFVNAVLRNLLRRKAELLGAQAKRAGATGIAVRHSMPPWLIERWSAEHGEPRAIALAEAFNRPAGMSLAPLVANAVPPEGAEPGPLGSVFLPPGAALAGRDALAEGNWYAADLASIAAARAVASALESAPAGPVLDGCAAPGGKSLLLRAAGCARPIVALEPEKSRIKTLRENFAKIAPPPFIARGDLARPPARPGAFAAVWADAPCSAAGTLRKSPEKKWSLEPEAPAMHAARQRELLFASCEAVMPGGLLVYSVCTPLATETRDVIAEFITERPQFTPQSLTGPAAELPWEKWGGGWIAMPDKGEWEGFFLAIMKREG